MGITADSESLLCRMKHIRQGLRSLSVRPSVCLLICLCQSVNQSLCLFPYRVSKQKIFHFWHLQKNAISYPCQQYWDSVCFRRDLAAYLQTSFWTDSTCPVSEVFKSFSFCPFNQWRAYESIFGTQDTVCLETTLKVPHRNIFHIRYAQFIPPPHSGYMLT